MKYCTYVISNVFLCHFHTDSVTLYFSNHVVLWLCSENGKGSCRGGKKDGKMF